MYCDDNSALEFTEGKDLIKPSTPPESEATICACFAEISREVRSVFFGFPFPRKVISLISLVLMESTIKTFKFWYLNLGLIFLVKET